MSDIPTISWLGESGTEYLYHVYPLRTVFPAVAGNYAFAKEMKPGSWTPLRFGQTSDLSRRFDLHSKMHCVESHGGTHIHVHADDSGEQDRLREEKDLIGACPSNVLPEAKCPRSLGFSSFESRITRTHS